MKLSKCLARSCLVVLAVMSGTEIHAQQPANQGGADYPAKPIRIVVGFTPGGGPDITARLIGPKLTERWGQQVIVENRPGAGGTIAALSVAGAPPDGYTLLSVTISHVVAPAIYSKLAYDTVNDFAGITLTGKDPGLLLVPNSLGVKSVSDLIALAKAKPNQLNFASAGVGSGSHFAAEQFTNMAGISVVHVPFKGIPEAITDTLTGRVQFFMANLSSAFTLVSERKVTAIAILGKQRSSRLPEIPTVSESGLPGYVRDFWYGLLAPARTPRAIIARLNREITGVLGQPDIQKNLLAQGMEPAPSSPEEFDKLIVQEIATLTKLARAANIKAE